MPHSKQQGFEEVDSQGTLFLFKADFGFSLDLKELSGSDPFTVAELVSKADPEAIRNVLMSSLYSRANESADNLSKEAVKEIIEEFITLHGIQECWVLAQHMLSHAIIGSIKKKAIDQNQSISRMIDSLTVSPWKSFKSHALLWVYLLTASTVCLCMSFKFIVPHIV